MYTKTVMMALMLLVTSVTETAMAEAKKDDAALLQTLRKAQGLLRQVSQEKTELETRNTQLQEQIQSLETRVNQLAPLENQVRETQASLDQLRHQNAGLQQRVSEGTDRYRGLVDKEHQVELELNRYKRDNQTLVDAVRERTQWVAACSKKNADMLSANQELVGKYKEKGFWAKVSEIEPFIQTGRVERENEAQNYRYRLEDLEVTPWQDSSGSQGTETRQPEP